MQSARNLAVAGRASSGQAEDRILHPGTSLRRRRRRQQCGRGALSWAKGGEAGAVCTPQAPQSSRRGRRSRRRCLRRLRRGRAAAGGAGSGGGGVGAIVGAAAVVGRSPKGANPRKLWPPCDLNCDLRVISPEGAALRGRGAPPLPPGLDRRRSRGCRRGRARAWLRGAGVLPRSGLSLTISSHRVRSLPMGISSGILFHFLPLSNLH
jgi:hypothetical protein